MTNHTAYTHIRSTWVGALVLSAGVFLGGCRTDAGTGALLGSGAGAGLGAIIGHQSGHGAEGALIGAGAGALGGYIIGNESDKHKAERRRDPYYDY